MNSCIYQGHVRHHRFAPIVNRFTYGIFYLMLDLNELDTVFRNRLLWSTGRFSFAWLRRQDHFKDYVGDHVITSQRLRTCVVSLLEREGIESELGKLKVGPIKLLTQLRYLGFAMNPVCFYYCYGEDGQTLLAVIAEVNNTPWGQQHHYVIPAVSNQKLVAIDELEKEFHVSPFMPMSMDYAMRYSRPDEKLAVSIKNFEDGEKKLDVIMTMRRREITTTNLCRLLLLYPLITFKVFAAIYWQALVLFVKGCPFFAHPRNESAQMNVSNNIEAEQINSDKTEGSDSASSDCSNDDNSVLVG